MSTHNPNSTVFPNARDVAAAAESHRQLIELLSTEKGMQRLEIWDDEQRPHTIEMPALALRQLDQILQEFAVGNAARIVSIRAELTLIEAADLLDVTRLRLVELLDENVIPYTNVGRRRQVKYADVIAYKQRRTADSRQAMDDLSVQAQEFKMGYE